MSNRSRTETKERPHENILKDLSGISDVSKGITNDNKYIMQYIKERVY